MSRRTSGDGMENTSAIMNENILLNKVKQQLNISIDKQLFDPVEPKGTIIRTIPKYVPNKSKPKNLFSKKHKEPKFVPCEPYKASVEPIILSKKTAKVDSEKPSKNNVSMQDLVTQLSQIRTIELNKSVKPDDSEIMSKNEWEQAKTKYEIDIKNLKETVSHLENQLKFQIQVNSELKTLLVAAVGEDLESRVQHLTEDKIQLARALLNSANHLTSHQEQTEWLSGQCEVWKSKFLASSVMVEELAHWKCALKNKINECQDVIKGLLKERSYVKKNMCQVHKNLTVINNSSNSNENDSCNFVELGKKLVDISQKVFNESSSTDVKSNLILSNTFYENFAKKVLDKSFLSALKPDMITNALVGATLSKNQQGQSYFQFSPSCSTCSHCKGNLQDI